MWKPPIGGRGRALTSYVKVRLMLGAAIRNRSWQVRRVMRSGLRRLNVGCGSRPTPGFINLDWEWRPGIDLCWDLNRGIPLPDNHVERVYSEHCLEHFSPDMARSVLREIHRVMTKGGVLRIIVPDAQIYLDAYQRSKDGPQAFPYASPQQMQAEGLTPLMAVNQMIFFHGHLYMYDFDTLRAFLVQAGFERVERAGFGSGTEGLLLDAPDRACESLYVEAWK